MQYYYSAVNNAFYPTVLRQKYAERWPDDAVSVSDSVFNEYGISIPPDGKIRVAGSDGLPAWGDIPPPALEQVIATNTIIFNRLMTTATVAAFAVQSSAMVGNPRDGDSDRLLQLQQYLDALRDVDLTQQVPDWPPAPPFIL